MCDDSSPTAFQTLSTPFQMRSRNLFQRPTMSGIATSVASVSCQEMIRRTAKKTSVWMSLDRPSARFRVTSVRTWSTSFVIREMIWPDLVRWKNPRSMSIRWS